MALRSFKIAPANLGPGKQLKQPDYWLLLETTGGKVRELDRYPTYPEALQANRALCDRLH
ncbi:MULTISPECIES: hypothetical protein [Modicisalibacter]|uniref:hypothetical protein n=1 Tax=Modicisalibacter TaxID=574347 RepID=UPI00100BCC34|nr:MULTISPECIES: hypothetical protein [Halomonadaceae]MBZ9558916.1 hypothetical protein [Modicisalibacter sp. R2A 31.J]MBZ9575192.1 hypothetical protein [Modicisalibacter sp. MOD 31.J]